MKKIIVIVLLLLILQAGARIEEYKLNVITDPEPITATNTAGENITLYPAYTADHERIILLEDVTPNTVYTVTLYTCGTASLEDDHIIKVEEEPAV